jgi:hypothetical protein
MTTLSPKTSLAEFVRQCWPELAEAWHRTGILDHLQAIAERRAPPRLNKPKRKRRRPGIGGLRATARIEDDR